MFRQKCILRRYQAQDREAEDASFFYDDQVIRMNVQPLSSKELQALPEGTRSQARVRAFGDFPVRVASQAAGTPSDRLWYHGCWYECELADCWEHTPLSHYESQWVAVPEGDEELPPEEGCMV